MWLLALITLLALQAANVRATSAPRDPNTDADLLPGADRANVVSAPPQTANV